MTNEKFYRWSPWRFSGISRAFLILDARVYAHDIDIFRGVPSKTDQPSNPNIFIRDAELFPFILLIFQENDSSKFALKFERANLPTKCTPSNINEQKRSQNYARKHICKNHENQRSHYEF